MKYVVGLLAIISIVACKQTRQKEEPKSYFCSPQLEAFFSGADSLPVIEFEYDDSLSLIKERLAQLIDTNTTSQDYFIFFKIKYTIDSGISPIYLKVYIDNPFPAFLPPYCGLRQEVEIAINNDGLYLVEGEIGDSSSIRNITYKNITNNGKDVSLSSNPRWALSSINWDYGAPKVQFDAAIEAILNGYTEVINDASFKKFNKEFCLLTPIEGGEILSEYNFNLKLRYRELEYQKFALDTIIN